MEPCSTKRWTWVPFMIRTVRFLSDEVEFNKFQIEKLRLVSKEKVLLSEENYSVDSHFTKPEQQSNKLQKKFFLKNRTKSAKTLSKTWSTNSWSRPVKNV